MLQNALNQLLGQLPDIGVQGFIEPGESQNLRNGMPANLGLVQPLKGHFPTVGILMAEGAFHFSGGSGLH